MRYENVGNLRSCACIINLLKLGDPILTERVLSKQLDYAGYHEEVTIYLCSRNKAAQLKRVMRLTALDPNHNDDIFFKAAATNREVLHLLSSRHSSTPGENLDKYLAIRSIV